LAAQSESSSWILGEAVLLDDDLVEVVFEIVGTHAASMAVVNGEEGALGPSEGVLALRSGHVEDDRNPILIIVPLYSLVGVGRVTGDESVRLGGELGIFEVLEGVEVIGVLADGVHLVELVAAMAHAHVA
jgi:hypothetical protein